ncbi:MAG: FecR domain-containing protein [Candidatus Thiodiazotropha sp.]
MTWTAVALNQWLCPGDRIRVGAKSRTGLTLENDTLLRLDEYTNVTISRSDEDGASWLSILKGIAHFISRVKGSFRIETPYVNASIEGTEFVVSVDDAATEIVVFEGVVVASNSAGSINLAANQSGRAGRDQTPVRTTLANPRDAVTWTLYYPPLPGEPDPAYALAHQAITAIAQNRLNDAIEFARQAIAENSGSAAAYMAQSYVDQAQFDIAAALKHSTRAAELAGDDALTQARLAEVLLMNGELRAAQETADKAVALNPNLSLTHTVLGFSSLRKVSLDSAKAAFKKAIELDSSAPLPHLGLGLAMIRHGELEAGRKELEVAVLLDPNSALMRSYLGKAYYEETRDRLASDQLAMAKLLDPNDPTAWFYDSILLQSENRPVAALRAQQQAVRLNDNRGVYRSRQLLDQDQAARNTATGRIYTDLGFEKLAVKQGAKSLAQAPDNFSAHRFMADINSTQPQRRRAVESDLLQSKLLQPLTAHTLRPQLSGLQLADGPARLSYNEFNPLFAQSGPSVLIDGFTAGNSTWGDDVIASYMHNRFSISLAQYHYESDGFRELDWLDKDTKSAFLQVDLTPSTMVQFEYSDDEQENGDLNQHFFATDSAPEFREEKEGRSRRFGFRHAFSNRSTLLGNYARTDTTRHARSNSRESTATEAENRNRELQWIFSANRANLIFGGNQLNRDTSLDSIFSFPGVPDVITAVNSDYKYSSIYAYGYLSPIPNLALTLGASYSRDEVSRITTNFSGIRDNGNDENQLNPKLGLVWDITDRTSVRAALYRERPLITTLATLEPTQIAGFNQIYDDFQETLVNDARRAGLGVDTAASDSVALGISTLFSDLRGLRYGEVPSENIEIELDRQLLNAYLYYTINEDWLLNLEYELDRFKSNDDSGLGQKLVKLKTHKLPVTLRHYFYNAFSASVTSTYYTQKGTYRGDIEAKDNFWLVDANITYDLPKRLGKLSIGAKNLFDKDFNFEDIQHNTWFNPDQSNNIGELSTERIVYGEFSIQF